MGILPNGQTREVTINDYTFETRWSERPGGRPETEFTRATPRRLYRKTHGKRLGAIATQLGQVPMPHQQYIYDVLGEVLTDEECEEMGVPFGTRAYRNGGLYLNRQVGKTVINLAFLLERAIFWKKFNSRANVGVYTAQTGQDSREKLLEDFAPLMEESPSIMEYVSKFDRGKGSEKIVFKRAPDRGRPIIILGKNTSTGNHGKTVDQVSLDELFAYRDFAVEVALKPALQTRHQAQIIWSSAAGTAESIVLNHKKKIFTKALQKDPGVGNAYFEFEAPRSVETLNEEAWWQYHPALGHTVNLIAFRAEIEEREEDFRRMFLNISSHVTGDQKVPMHLWSEAEVPNLEIKSKNPEMVIAVDVSVDRSKSAVAIANRKKCRAELVAYGDGTDWVKGLVSRIGSTQDAEVLYHGRGASASIADDTWQKLSISDIAVASGTFFDDIITGTVKVTQNDVLEPALAHSVTREVGELWVFDPKTSIEDVSPLNAIIMALYGPYERQSSEIFIHA